MTKMKRKRLENRLGPIQLMLEAKWRLSNHFADTKICPGYESQGTFEDSGLNIREEPRAKFDVPGATKIQTGLGRKIYGNY
tara:strand:+ start:530 stop:772 length:243 start_codon:yes stop_codon:yes gene_type:complete